MSLDALPADVQRYLRSLVYAYQVCPHQDNGFHRTLQSMVALECRRYDVPVREVADRVEQCAMVEDGREVAA